jgi:hypothetical protein
MIVYYVIKMPIYFCHMSGNVFYGSFVCRKVAIDHNNM